LRVEDRGFGWALVRVLTVDPLAGVLALDAAPGGSPRVVLGRDEGGVELAVDDAADLPHLIVQGQTRSGKSTWLYALLVQLVRQQRVIVAGVDPSGITLRPFAGTRHARWQASGLSDLDALEGVLVALVDDMDTRLAAMPLDRDILPVSDEYPLVVTVLEEYPALLRALDAADPKQGKRCRALVARLLAESHKVGHRVVIAAQRAEAGIVGAAERAQCGGRLSFRVDSADSVKLLHPDAELLAAGHTAAEPGIALCSWPGRPLTRMRGPFLGGYREYSAAITAACRPDPAG
jgi:DNA segregation ATPase FtsK/SpoIIIE-like protein